MFSHLTIYDPRERALVGVADAALSAAAVLVRPFRRGPAASSQRILLLRLERIGDLLMTLDAIAAVRALAPGAAIDLVVGSWNRELAQMIDGPSRIETLDAPWLARGRPGATTGAMIARAREWRRRRYDLALNFEGDIRTNLLLALGGARRRIGFGMAGGGAALTDVVPHDARSHTRVNAMSLVARAFGQDAVGALPGGRACLIVPDDVRAEAARQVSSVAGGGPLVGIHASGGRAIKQWDADRFAAVADRLAREHGAAIVLTGTAEDRELVEGVARRLPAAARTVDLAGAIELPLLAAILERLDLLVTGDTGPMHLAAAVGTPVVAIFGPSDPARYAPLEAASAIVRIDLPCSPCNRIRLPPERCVGHTPDCLAGVSVEQVHAAAVRLLEKGR